MSLKRFRKRKAGTARIFVSFQKVSVGIEGQDTSQNSFELTENMKRKTKNNPEKLKRLRRTIMPHRKNSQKGTKQKERTQNSLSLKMKAEKVDQSHCYFCRCFEGSLIFDQINSNHLAMLFEKKVK